MNTTQMVVVAGVRRSWRSLFLVEGSLVFLHFLHLRVNDDDDDDGGNGDDDDKHEFHCWDNGFVLWSVFVNFHYY